MSFPGRWAERRPLPGLICFGAERRQRRKEEPTRSEEAGEGGDAQENVDSCQLRLQHFPRHDESQKLQDRHEIVGDESSNQFHTNDEQESSIDQLVEGLRRAPVQLNQRENALVSEGNDTQKNPEGQEAFESGCECLCRSNYELIHANCNGSAVYGGRAKACECFLPAGRRLVSDHLGARTREERRAINFAV